MAKVKTFNGVSSAIWECVQKTGAKNHTVYAPEGANKGIATNETPVGTVTVTFDFDPSAEKVDYVITKKPFIVGDEQIWDMIQKTIDSCSGKS